MNGKRQFRTRLSRSKVASLNVNFVVSIILLLILCSLAGSWEAGNNLFAEEEMNEAKSEEAADTESSNEKTEPATEKWNAPSWDAIREQYRDWLTDSGQEEQLRAAWDRDRQSADAATLEWLANRAIQINPEWEPYLSNSAFDSASLDRGRLYDTKGFFAVLDHLNQSGISADLRLYAAVRLIQKNQFDSGAKLLSGIEYKQSGSPARLLFYQGLAAYEELNFEAARQKMNQLLAGESIPIRYRTLGEQIKRDLDNLDPKGLDHVSRRMNGSYSRLADGQTNQKVRAIQDGIVKSLDDQIEQLEKQLQQMQSSSSQSSAPSGPSPKEYGPSAGRSAGQAGEANKPAKVLGDADGKNRKEDEWGSLPDKQREADLQQIQERFPPHYRDIIEQYFKKMAQ